MVILEKLRRLKRFVKFSIPPEAAVDGSGLHTPTRDNADDDSSIKNESNDRSSEHTMIPQGLDDIFDDGAGDKFPSSRPQSRDTQVTGDANVGDQERGEHEKKNELDGTPALKIPDEAVEIPQWFLENCVKTAAEWVKYPNPLIIRKSKFSDQKHEQSLSEKSSLDTYEMDSVLYEAISNVMVKPSTLAEPHQTQKSPNVLSFTNDAILITLPDSKRHRWGHKFLNCLVQQFAKTITADLVTFTLDDISDLAEHFIVAKNGRQGQDSASYMRAFFQDYQGYNQKLCHNPKLAEVRALLRQQLLPNRC